MGEVLLVLGVAVATVLATGLGAVPVLLVGDRARGADAWLDGLVVGVMGVAAVVGLLLPALDEGGPGALSLGAAAGAAGLLWARRRLHERHTGTDPTVDADEEAATLTFGVLLVHSLPEGLALGSAMAASGALAVFVVCAIALQNVPEGTATAAAIHRAGGSRRRQFGAALLSSAPQVPGALIAWWAVDAVDAVLPFTLAAAGGAMVVLLVIELVPSAWSIASHRAGAAGGFTIGAVVTLGLSLALGTPA